MLGKQHDITNEIRREEELKRSNEELKRFAYVASHDLKAPMRNVRQLASWLQEDLHDIPRESRSHLQLLQDSLQRMENLTSNLLDYSSVSNSSHQVTDVDTYQLITDINTLLQPPPDFRIRPSGDMPVIHTQRAPLEQTLRNLIWNAIVHAPEPRGNIAVWTTINGRYIVFHIADDGKPIPEEHQNRIFNMFEKLHSQGTGMGLAIARKLVESR